jgi:hypothetical protein
MKKQQMVHANNWKYNRDRLQVYGASIVIYPPLIITAKMPRSIWNLSTILDSSGCLNYNLPLIAVPTENPNSQKWSVHILLTWEWMVDMADQSAPFRLGFNV